MEDQDVRPGRIRLARELAGWSQTDLAARIGKTGAAVSQYESGTHRPTPEVMQALASQLDVPISFFSLPLEETHEGFFRSLRRSSSTDRRRARATAQIAHDVVAGAPESFVPALDVPTAPVDNLDVDERARRSIERRADRLRADWGVPAGQVANVVELLEAHGVLVVRSPLRSADVDAFSLPFEDRPVVVLGTDKGDRARSRFDAAHELGHLVLHGEQVWGVKEVEKQANFFAAAFLMPAEDIRAELPSRADWNVLFQLKAKWQVSLAALLMRAKTLGVMNDAAYLAAIKAASARGWRRTEPVPLGRPERPTLLLRVVERSLNGDDDTGLPPQVLRSLVEAAA